jgi:hypothetical protein
METCEAEMKFKYTNHIYGIHWSIAFGVPCLIHFALLAVLVVLLSGCTFNRNAPLINHNAPFLEVRDSANGNTITPKP